MFHQLSKAVLLMQKGNLPQETSEAGRPVNYERTVKYALSDLCHHRGIVGYKASSSKSELIQLLRDDDLARRLREKEDSKSRRPGTKASSHWREIGMSSGALTEITN